MEEDKLKYYLILNMIEGLGSVRINNLLKYFGSAEAIYKAKFNDLVKVEKIGKELAEKIIIERERINITQELKKIKENKVKVITIEDDDYPINLKAIYDPPVVLYIKGNIRKEELCIAMVGTRTPTEYGLLQARHLSKRLANLGFCIVSGLARGIDTACHKAALEENGLTYGVLGCGIDVVYPPENSWLYRRIPESGGGIITEFPFGTKPYKQNFPKRNRIISGLSLGVVVIEAPPKSGALITANLALHQNREVFAVPGPVNSLTSLGVNNLIKEGAKLTSSIEDILQELWFMVKDKLKKEPQLTKAEEEIYNLIKDEPIDIDSLKLLSDKDFGYLSIILLNLELKGLIRQLIGKRFVRV